jgi:hypothetical protein
VATALALLRLAELLLVPGVTAPNSPGLKRNNQPSDAVRVSMMRIAVSAIVAGTRWSAACGGDDQRPLIPDHPTSEQALELIRSCEVEFIFFPAESGAFLTLRDGRVVSVARPTRRDDLAEAAKSVSAECEIPISIE